LIFIHCQKLIQELIIQHEGRFDVKVRYDDLQMPEFIGGFSEPVQFGAQSQTVQRADTGNSLVCCLPEYLSYTVNSIQSGFWR
jgi:hypothetical protein